jgi:hypothetical protein
MTLRILFYAFALGAGATFTATLVNSQDPKAGKEPMSKEMQEMMAGMKEWASVMSPGEHHKALNELVGNYDTVTKLWMGGPGTPPTESKGTTERKWVLGNRFILEEAKGEWAMPDMASGGTTMKLMPMQGMGLFGYDNYRNMYVGCWADNMGTQMLTMKGMADPSGKVFTYFGEMDEPMLKVIGRTVKYVTRIVDKDTQVFEIFDLHAGPDYKVVEVTYKRKK